METDSASGLGINAVATLSAATPEMNTTAPYHHPVDMSQVTFSITGKIGVVCRGVSREPVPLSFRQMCVALLAVRRSKRLWR